MLGYSGLSLRIRQNNVVRQLVVELESQQLSLPRRIIVAETAYATPSTDEEKKVKLIETKTDPSVTGPTGPVKATLLETSWNAGEDFATLVTEEFTGTVEEFTAERVYCVVVPKSEEALASWFEDYVVPITTEGANPTAPFLWRLDEMWITDPVVINFKIRNEPHIIGDDDDGLEPMVQMYPTSGSGLVVAVVSPLQPVKCQPVAGVAVSVTGVPCV